MLLWHLSPTKNHKFLKFTAQTRTFHCLVHSPVTSISLLGSNWEHKLFPWGWSKQRKNYFSAQILTVCTLSQLLYLRELTENLFKQKEKSIPRIGKSPRISHVLTALRSSAIPRTEADPLLRGGVALPRTYGHSSRRCLEAYAIHPAAPFHPGNPGVLCSKRIILCVMWLKQQVFGAGGRGQGPAPGSGPGISPLIKHSSKLTGIELMPQC